MEAFVARHPIFEQHKRVHGYELEFRSGFEEFYNTVDTEKAKVDFLAFVNFDELVGPTNGFLTFSRHLLIQQFPILLPNERLTVVLPAGMEADEEMVGACRTLKESGYVLMMDEFASRALHE